MADNDTTPALAPPRLTTRGKPFGKPGFPTKYDPKQLGNVTELARNGATDREIAAFLGVTEQTFYNWLHCHAELVIALKLGKEASDERVVRSLYRRATGYSFDSEKIYQHQGEIIRAETVEHVPPDTTAAIFWLKNRRPKEWREKMDIEQTVTHEIGDSVTSLLGRIRGERTVQPIELDTANPGISEESNVSADSQILRDGRGEGDKSAELPAKLDDEESSGPAGAF